LEGDIEEPMYIEWPEGMVELGSSAWKNKETCAELQKACIEMWMLLLDYTRLIAVI